MDTNSGDVDYGDMSTCIGLNVSLTPDMERFVLQRVATGRYKAASEVLRKGLRLLERQGRDHDAAFAALRTKLQRGSKQADDRHFVDRGQILKQNSALKRRRRTK